MNKIYDYNIYAAMRQLGVTRLRTKQSKVLSCILQNRDVLVRLCTGGGKSLLFQLPALLDEPGQLTLVFSPLLALQEDQVSALKTKGVRAALLNSSLSKRRHAATLRDFVQNGGLLYLAPEQLRREDVRTALSTARVRRVVVDEVHILPQVDRGFRPAYAEFGAFIADQGAEQCGFCNPGFMMNAIALFREKQDPTDEEIKEYLAGNLCRCSGYEGQLRGIRAYLDWKKQREEDAQ